jgi:hypothetical protein
MKTTLSDGEMIAMSNLAAGAKTGEVSAYYSLWQELCARLQQDKIESADRIKAMRRKRR